MVRLNLALSNCRGQCYDGAANMAGIRTGVATQIRAEEPRAVYSHCYGHALNLAACDSIKKNKILCDVLDSVNEISKLLKFSPQRSAKFAKLKQEIAPGTPGFRTLCPTRWTVRGNSLKSVIDNYSVFQVMWEEVKEEVRDVEIRARVIGVEAVMTKFSFLFGLILSEKILQHTDNLSKTLQTPALTASEGQEIADLTCQTLERMRTDEMFDLFWMKVIDLQRKNGVNEPCLPRKRRAPHHLEVGSSESFHHSSPKEYYKQQYFECLDFIVTAIRDRFNQPGYVTLKNLENLLIKAANGKEYSEELAFVIDCYSDVTESSLSAQLQNLTTAFASSPEKPTLRTIKEYIISLSPAQQVSVSEICILLKLIMVIPATNAISERSASTLRRVKTYLRTTMSQLRLNNLLILHAHKDRTDSLTLSECLNDFITNNEHRLQIFGKFK